MIEKRTEEEIEKWAKELVLSHGGSVSAKTIRGTVRYYLQWKEHGRYRSKYLRATEVAAVRRQLALMRGKAVAENPLSLEVVKSSDVYETNVCTGKSLLEFAEEARGLLTRDAFPHIEAYIKGPRTSKVFVIYGLRRTGKTTMIRQSILSLPDELRVHAAYVKVGTGGRRAFPPLERALRCGRAHGCDQPGGGGHQPQVCP